MAEKTIEENEQDGKGSEEYYSDSKNEVSL